MTANTRREKREAAEKQKIVRNQRVAVEAAKDAERKPLKGEAQRAAIAAQTRATPKLTRKQQVEAAHAAAEEQSRKDALLKPQLVEDNYPVGTTPPLHVLNQRARIASQQARDHAMEIGRQVGGVARDLIAGREPRIKRGNRHERYAQATIKMADARKRHEAEQAAKAAEQA